MGKYNKTRLNRIVGSLFIALAFSETIKRASVWFYPLAMLLLLTCLMFANMISDFGVRRGDLLFRKYFVYGAIPYLTVLLYGILVIILDGRGGKFLSRSFGSALIACSTVVISAAVLYVFRQNAVDLLCNGLLISYLFHIVLSIKDIGISGVVIHFLHPLNTYESVFEMHSTGFTLNLLLLYYVVRRDKKDRMRVVLILVALYLIMKRIAFAGLLLSLFVWFFLDIIFLVVEKKKYVLVWWTLVIASIMYVWIIALHPGLYRTIMDKAGILNRFLMAESFREYYQFHPLFWGRGYGFVSVMIPKMDIAGATVEALHNDILKDYIEEGFLLFCALYWYIFVGCPRHLFRKSGKRVLSCVTVILVYTFITLLTDNVLDYISYTCSLFTIYGALFMYGDELFPNIRKKKNTC